MVASQRQDKFAGVRIVAKPGVEGKAARQLAFRIEHKGSGRENCTGFKHAASRQYHHLDGQFGVSVLFDRVAARYRRRRHADG